MHTGAAHGENLEVAFGGPDRKVSRVQKGIQTYGTSYQISLDISDLLEHYI